MPKNLDQLKASIARLERSSSTMSTYIDNGTGNGDESEVIKIGLDKIDNALPWNGLPRGCVHEIMSPSPDDAAATGFLAYLMGQQAKAGHLGTVLWVSCRDDLFAPGLAVFGWRPDRFLAVQCQTGQDVLWSMEEGLRCPALAAVAGDTSDLDFDTTRRLHLAARRSGLPLFLIKPRRAILTPSAATTRWCITSKATETDTGRTGWRVDLLRCRGGKSQSWDVDFNLDEQRITDDIKHHAKYSQPVAYAA